MTFYGGMRKSNRTIETHWSTRRKTSPPQVSVSQEVWRKQNTDTFLLKQLKAEPSVSKYSEKIVQGSGTEHHKLCRWLTMTYRWFTVSMLVIEEGQEMETRYSMCRVLQGLESQWTDLAELGFLWWLRETGLKVRMKFYLMFPSQRVGDKEYWRGERSGWSGQMHSVLHDSCWWVLSLAKWRSYSKSAVSLLVMEALKSVVSENGDLSFTVNWDLRTS